MRYINSHYITLHYITKQAAQHRIVVSVLTSRSRDDLETYQRLVSVSSRQKFPTSRSRLGLGHLRLVSKTNFGQIVQAT